MPWWKSEQARPTIFTKILHTYRKPTQNYSSHLVRYCDLATTQFTTYELGMEELRWRFMFKR